MIPTPYIRDNKRCGFAPVFVPGELYQFYINLIEPTNDPLFGNFWMNLYNSKNVKVEENIAEMKQDVVRLDLYNIIVNMEFPAVTENGLYYFIIENHVANEVKATSNYIQVENDEEAYFEHTSYVAWRNRHNINGIQYENNPNFYNILRLPIIQVDFQFDSEVKQYRNVTNRKLRNTKTYKDEIARLETYYLDIEGHRAASALFDHDTIFINGVNVTAKTAYTRDNGTGLSKFTKGTIDVIIDDTIELPPALAIDTFNLIDANGDRIIDADDIRIRHS